GARPRSRQGRARRVQAPHRYAQLGHGERANPHPARRTPRPAHRGTRTPRIKGKPRPHRPRSGADEIRRARPALLRRTGPEPLMPLVAALFLAGREWLVPAAIAAGVALSLVTASYLRTPGP